MAMMISVETECPMTAIPIPPHELKRGTWYYGVRCACARLHALCEDLFAGKTSDPYLDCLEPLDIACPCGAVMHVERLHRFKTT